MVSYELGTDPEGRARAVDIARLDAKGAKGIFTFGSAVRFVTATLGLGLVGTAAWTRGLGFDVALLYSSMSAVGFLMYLADKSAAAHREWRTRENTLHLLALAGGWPGALLAQRILRHKSRKRSFQVTFWLTVVLNCSGMLWALSPAGSVLLRGWVSPG
jgi:uncharacterized membrane protein YsdA (DUF1294 family)